MKCPNCNRRYVHERCYYCCPIASPQLGILASYDGNGWYKADLPPDMLGVPLIAEQGDDGVVYIRKRTAEEIEKERRGVVDLDWIGPPRRLR